MRDVGKFLLRLLKERNQSLRSLASQAGISNSYLSQLTRGLFIPTPEILIKLATHLGVTPRKIFEEAGWLEPELDREKLPKGLALFVSSSKCPADITDEEMTTLAAKGQGKQPLAPSRYAQMLKELRERPLYRIHKTLQVQPLTVQEDVAKYVESAVAPPKRRRRRQK